MIGKFVNETSDHFTCSQTKEGRKGKPCEYTVRKNVEETQLCTNILKFEIENP